MHRYHLEFRHPNGTALLDTQGDELAELELAKAQARIVIRRVLKQATPEADWSEWVTAIRDDEGTELAVLRFRDVMELDAA